MGRREAPYLRVRVATTDQRHQYTREMRRRSPAHHPVRRWFVRRINAWLQRRDRRGYGMWE